MTKTNKKQLKRSKKQESILNMTILDYILTNKQAQKLRKTETFI